MSANPLDEIWSAICDECKKTISEVAFNCFLKDLKPVILSDGEFTISINDEYKKGVIEQTYIEKLNYAIKTIMGVDMVARIVLDEDEEEISLRDSDEDIVETAREVDMDIEGRVIETTSEDVVVDDYADNDVTGDEIDAIADLGNFTIKDDLSDDYDM